MRGVCLQKCNPKMDVSHSNKHFCINIAHYLFIITIKWHIFPLNSAWQILTTPREDVNGTIKVIQKFRLKHVALSKPDVTACLLTGRCSSCGTVQQLQLSQIVCFYMSFQNSRLLLVIFKCVFLRNSGQFVAALSRQNLACVIS